MQTEIEVKFLNIDLDLIRAKLLESGAICEQPMRLMRRAIIDTPDLNTRSAYVRIRDEGHRVTLTYKQFDALSIDGAKEIEVEVDSFDGAVAIFEQVGLAPRSYQESKRETWQLGDVEVVIDEWPWLNPYIEIEGANEEALIVVAGQLGFDWGNAVFGDVMVAYRAQYTYLMPGDGRDVGNVPEVRFGDPLPELMKDA